VRPLTNHTHFSIPARFEIIIVDELQKDARANKGSRHSDRTRVERMRCIIIEDVHQQQQEASSDEFLSGRSRLKLSVGNVTYIYPFDIVHIRSIFFTQFDKV
jgi:hypothetical protein